MCDQLDYLLKDPTEATTDEAIAALRSSAALRPFFEGRAHLADHIAGSLCATSFKGSIGDWVQRTREVLTDLDLEDLASSSWSAVSSVIVERFRERGVLEWQFRVGTECLAILEEDRDWHSAVVASELSCAGRQRIIFDEWQKPQWTDRDALVVVARDDDDERYEDSGQCRLCQREMPLTFHHLVPKEEHHHYVGKEPHWLLLENTKEEKKDLLLHRKKPLLLTKLDLNSHGIMICRPCHSAVHRAETNATLGRSYCTLEALASHPSVAKFVAYARKQKLTSRR